MPDSYRQIALAAISTLGYAETMIEMEFGVGNPSEDYHEDSKALAARVTVLDLDLQEDGRSSDGPADVERFELYRLACGALAKLVRQDHPHGLALADIAACWGEGISPDGLVALRILDSHEPR